MEWRVVAGGLETRMGDIHSRAEVESAAEGKLSADLIGRVVDFEFPVTGGPASHLIVAEHEFRRVE